MDSNSDILTAAIRGEHVVEFVYEKARHVIRVVTFSPWELSDDGESIIGYDHGRDAIRRFSIYKIKDTVVASPGDDSYVQPQEG